NKGIERPEIVVYENAFHGRSIATLSATGNPKVQAGFGPLVEGLIRVPLNNIDALKAATQGNNDVVAVFVEAIQGEGGINPARLEYLKGLRQLCDRRGWLLMIDEVQCGLGRTGKWFAHQWADILPDVMPLAKGLASGVPVGAVVARGEAAHTFKPGNHGTTFGGNPLAMRAALTTLKTIEDEGLLDHVHRVGAYLHERLSDGLSGLAGVVDIRGRGLMLGIELDRPSAPLVRQGLDQGIVFNVTADSVVRLLPPLIFDQHDVDYLLDRLLPLIRQHLQTAH
ncbi:MAG: aminotransferase class III-fold pyridoxal phosphate-dependent enzyme, partial [Betaproteobacteria bacterium]|nr:aminotransferase class III-fold pyridoxal phosphate-dependent enzyme [Betaproteobacteria bacterium]